MVRLKELLKMHFFIDSFVRFRARILMYPFIYCGSARGSSSLSMKNHYFIEVPWVEECK